MPSSCAMRGCKHYDKKFKKEHGITYHRFPVEPTRKEIWSRILRKQRQDPYFNPCINTRICSAHFYESDFSTSEKGMRRLKPTAIPRDAIEIEVPSNATNLSTGTLQHATLPKSDDPLFVDLSDLNPIFDSPMIVHLKKRIEKLEKLHRVQSLKIKSLQKQNGRLIVKNRLLQDTNRALKQERIIMLEMESAAEGKVEKTEENESLAIMSETKSGTEAKVKKTEPNESEFMMVELMESASGANVKKTEPNENEETMIEAEPLAAAAKVENTQTNESCSSAKIKNNQIL